ncbi:MAG: Nif3-like dinuclear metal center hexameric protein [Gemmatimonadota bacterium]
MAELSDVTEYLDTALHIDEIEDYSGAYNGLQVECRSPIDSVCVATDACMATIERTAEEGANLLFVHHGMFWTDPLPLTGLVYRRLRVLIDNDIALYSCHLPLDVHPLFGNNAHLARSLDLHIEGRWGRWKSVEGLGVWAVVDRSLNDVVDRVERVCDRRAHVLRGGPPHVRRMAILTGGGGSMIEQAHAEGYDTLLTGEGAHHTYHEAMEYGINVIYAGHYATETFGVKAVGKALNDRFGVDWTFIDHPTGM